MQRVLGASVGDERNALLMLTVQVDFGAGKATLPGARLYLLDEHNKIKTEQVIFYAAQNRPGAGPRPTPPGPHRPSKTHA